MMTQLVNYRILKSFFKLLSNVFKAFFRLTKNFFKALEELVEELCDE